MAGRKSKPLFLRDGVYYARVAGKRWSTETSDEAEAMRRRAFMIERGKPWSDIKWDHGDIVELRIAKDGHTTANLIRRFTDPMEAIDTLNKNKKPIIKDISCEPPDDCKDLYRLIDYEMSLKKAKNSPEKTIKYWEQRFGALKRYIRDFELDLDSFTVKKALEYPNYRKTETVRCEGQLGFNNRKPDFPTINKEIGHWRNLWRRWHEEGRITKNVWVRVIPLGPTGTDDEIDDIEPYTFDEVLSILKNIDDITIRAVCIWQSMLGARPGEEVLRITGKMIRVNKIWNSKTRRWDVFSYSDEAKAFYAQYIEGKVGHLNADKVRDAFKKACKKAGIREGKPYDLRHWFGTESLLENKLEVVQVMLRHRNIKTTQIYAKVRNAEAAAALEGMQQKVLKAVEEQKENDRAARSSIKGPRYPQNINL